MRIYSQLAAITLILALVGGRAADASIVVGLVVDPATTAGASPDVSSIYSGAGTWHLFAVDDNVGDFGISTYSVHLAGTTTIRNTSPLAFQIQGSDGSIQQAGFNFLRSSNASSSDGWIHAAQSLPDQSPFLFAGLGQETGSFAAKAAAAQPGSSVMNGAVSPSWGTYNTISPLNGKNWLFLAEGTYASGVLPTISDAAFTVFSNPTTFHSNFSDTVVVPGPITPTLLTPEYVDHLDPRPLPNSLPAPKVAEPEPQPVVVANPPIVTPPSTLPDAPPSPPVANNESPAEIEPTGIASLPPDPSSPDSTWVSVPTGEGAAGMDHDGFIYYTYQPIDTAVTVAPPYQVVPSRPHGLQAAMMIALTGLRTAETFVIDVTNRVDSIPSMRLVSFSALDAGLMNQVSIESAVAAPEPAAVTLVGLASIGLVGLVGRRRS